MIENHSDCIVIGAGMTGMACAFELTKRGHRVLVLESESEAGGLLSSWHFDGFSIERYYHHFFNYDRQLLEMIQECGLSSDVVWKKASTGYYYRGEVYNLDTPREIFLYRYLSFYDKIRLSFAVLMIKNMKDFRHLDKITAREWLLKNTTRNVYQNFFAPLLKSKFGSAADQISAAWLCARLKLRSNRKVSGEELGYLKDGFDTFLLRLRDLIEQRGRLETSHRVTKIISEGLGALGVETEQGTFHATTVVSTIAPKLLASLANFPPDYQQRLEHNRSQSVHCVLIGMKQPLLSTYWLNIRSDTLPFALLIEHTNFHDIPGYGGQKILYVASYHNGPDDPAYHRSEEDVIESYLSGLESEFGLDRNDVLWTRFSRASAVGPIYTVNFLDNLLSHDTPIPGLFLSGMMTSYPERGISVSIDQGKLAAEAVHSFIERRATT